MTDQDPDHAAIFETLAEVAEAPEPTTLRFTLADDDRTIDGFVEDPQFDRDPDLDSATVDLTLEFQEAIEVELPDDVDEDTAYSETGFVRAKKRRGEFQPAELCLTSAAREVKYPLVGEVESVERLDRD